MKTKLLTNIAFVLMLTSCINNDVYFQYKSVNEIGWSKDSVYKFDVSIDDTSALYNVYVNIRNNKIYPYQNLWLFLEKANPDHSKMKDSIECYLADQRGKWLGSGMGSILEMPVLYQQEVRFSHKGIYQYSIVQGMRDDILIGISDVGVRVEKVNK
jgi:gliding motility-associated lipoprotein GldH